MVQSMRHQITSSPAARIAEVYAQGSDGTWTCGSGIALGKSLILTAAHIFEPVHLSDSEESDKVMVRQIGGPLLPAAIRWHERHLDVDAAMLEVRQDAYWKEGIEVAFGRFACGSPIEVEAVGFPDFQASLDMRDTEQAR